MSASEGQGDLALHNLGSQRASTGCGSSLEVFWQLAFGAPCSEAADVQDYAHLPEISHA